MTENLFLILHKVRGEPAFDIASRIEATEGGSTADTWIIPTSGHRAYPSAYVSLNEIAYGLDFLELSYNGFKWYSIEDMAMPPPDLPDHYAANDTSRPAPVRRALASTTEEFLI